MNNSASPKLFKKGDIIVYALLISLVIALLLIVFFQKPASHNGLIVSIDNKTVMQFDFNENKAEISKGFEGSVVKLNDKQYKILSKYGYNIIEIDVHNKSVKVVETDCGLTKECTKMNAANGVIICAPHKLTVRLVQNKNEIKTGEVE